MSGLQDSHGFHSPFFYFALVRPHEVKNLPLLPRLFRRVIKRKKTNMGGEMKTVRFAFFVLFAVAFLLSPVWAESDWEQVISKNGVDAYVRPVEGTRVLEVRAVTVIPARMEVVTEAMRDVERHPEWRPACKESRIIRKHGPYSMTVHDVTECPWPIKDRDVVLKCSVVVETEAARGVANLSVVEDSEVPEVKGRVRITEMEAKYYLQYISEGKTGVVFTTRVNPAGSIPMFLINFFNKHYCYMQLQALKKQVQKERYIIAARESGDKQIIDGVMEDRSLRKKILANRLCKFIKSSEFVDMVVNDDDLFENAFNSGRGGDFGEILLYGWGSEESRKTAVSHLIKRCASHWSDDESFVNEVCQNEDLIMTILNGRTCEKGSICSRIKGASRDG